jgi:hypothetical protein
MSKAILLDSVVTHVTKSILLELSCDKAILLDSFVTQTDKEDR